jgi:nonsense-mediated mRNA decay protein 3
MFCVECGRETEIFKEGLCKECYLKTHQFTEGTEFIDIPVCVHCGVFKYKNTWMQENLEKVLVRYIKNSFKISNQLKKIKIEPQCSEEKERINCQVSITGFIDDQKIVEKHQVFVRLKQNVCNVCSKQFGGYHEAIIQVRAEDRDLTENELDRIVLFVFKMVENMQEKGQRGVFLADYGEEHGGFDFFLSNKQAAYNITKKLQEEYGGNIKKSSKNIGMKEGKQIYRNTFLLRLPNLTKDDYIRIKNNFFQVIYVKSNKIKIRNLSNWKEEIITLDNVENKKPVNEKIISKERIVVSQTKNELQLMDQDTYETFQLKKPIDKHFKSKTVKTLTVDEQVFLDPKNIRKI